ncbi:MAG: hypothetical protein PUG27_04200 [Succinatimonas sp.]|nr:hypothetical protein [Succinatimonas sp.]
MFPSKIRKDLEDFLMQDTGFVQDKIRLLAIAELKNKYKKAGKEEHYLSEMEIDVYIVKNNNALKQKCRILANSVSEKIIPESNISYLLRNIGFWSIFLVPMMYVIPTRLLEEFKKASMDEWNYDMLLAGGFGFISLILFFIGAIISIFKR